MAKKLINWKNKTILVVEDDDVSTEFFKELLMPTKAKILFAGDGETAIEIFKKNMDIDLILMDVQLPKISGTDAFLKIKELKSEVIVIAQTAFAMSGDKEKYINLGFDNYISKPINHEELLNMMENHFLIK